MCRPLLARGVRVASIKTPRELASEAQTLAASYEYTLYREVLYMPVDYEEGDLGVVPPPERRSWMPMKLQDIQQKALEQFDTLFVDQAQTAKFYYMVAQIARRAKDDSPVELLVKTRDGLRTLDRYGKLNIPDGSFIPNMLGPVLNDNEADKAEVLEIITEWLGGEEAEATSLLRHLATALAPAWSAGRYVLLMGDGRNGKSVLMTMLTRLFGMNNCSGVTRQDISEGSAALLDLNGKLLNVVFDGAETFLKDSGREKSLITGESVQVRRLYQSHLSLCQTNALFVEGLNTEPKSRDKTSALQARLVRFWFPNRYKDDGEFWATMMSERVLGAFLSLLMDNFVQEKATSVSLAPTARSRELRLEHMEDNSLALQFITYIAETDPLGEESLIGLPFEDVVQMFQSWRLKLNDLSSWDMQTVLRLFRPVMSTERKSVRRGGGVRKMRVVTKFSQETLELLELQKEDVHGDDTVVDDGDVLGGDSGADGPGAEVRAEGPRTGAGLA